MKHLIMYVSITALLIGCNKSNIQLDERYTAFVGEWESIDGETTALIKIENSGRFEIIKSAERNFKMKVNSLGELETITNYWYGTSWEELILYEIDRKGNYTHSSIIFFVDTKDTIIVPVGSVNYNPNIDGNSIRFVRK